MNPLDVARHTYAVRASGYTRVPAAVTGAWLEELTVVADVALAHAAAVLAEKGSLAHTNLGRGYMAARCLYCWGPAALRLIEHEDVRVLSQSILQAPRLWDLGVLSTQPEHSAEGSPAGSWHRDTKPVDLDTSPPPFVWFFFCVDATTPENGATWIVPGSHQKAAGDLSPDARAGDRPFPSAVQLCGEAGDLLIVNPSAIHSAGANRTDRPRRLVNVGLCSAGMPPLLNHWAVAGPAIQAQASPYLRAMLEIPDEPGAAPRDRTWDALPPGWKTA